jgi:non-ribosomal peptide synthetase component F
VVRIPDVGRFVSTAGAVAGVAGTMARAGVITPLRPDKYVRIAAAAQREGLSVATGFAMSAQRSPNRVALVDEIGELTFKQIDRRADADRRRNTSSTAAGETSSGSGCLADRRSRTRTGTCHSGTCRTEVR